MRRGTRQLGASPVLIGAVTVMVAIVAVFISYSANNGLPFVPTYQLEAQVPNGAKLVKGNEVRAGGFRVGIVKDIKSDRVRVNGQERAIAVLDLKLDKSIEPLAVDSTLSVRPRSALGLKYVELIPGRARKTFQDGDTIPIKNATTNAPELEDVLSTFPPETRTDARKSLEGFGNSIAGRGPAINTTIGELEPFTRYLLPVMRNLSDPKTELRNFFPGLEAAAAEAAPVARVQARCSARWPPRSRRSGATQRRCARRSRRARRPCRPRRSPSGCKRRSSRASRPYRATSSRAPRSCPARSRS